MIRRLILLLACFLSKVGGSLRSLANPDTPPFKAWLALDGDHTYRLDYPLEPNSVVMAVGGYKGNWTSDIFGAYVCTVHVYEPVADFVSVLTRRFRKNPHIQIHPVGLSNRDQVVPIMVDSDKSSVLTRGGRDRVTLVDAKHVIEEIGPVDLMMLNIEGSEYEVIERICASGAISMIRHLQVQFHDFVPNAVQRRRNAQEMLQATHSIEWEFPFIWESWTRRA